MSSRPSPPRLCAAIAVSLALAGCPSKTPPPAATNDAGATTPRTQAVAVVDAAVEASAPRDVTLGLVAETVQTMSLDVLADGRIVAIAGGLPFEARDDASLAPLVPYEGLASLFPDDDTLVGYAGSAFAAHAAYGPFDGRLLLAGARDASLVATIADRKVASTTTVNTSVVAQFAGRLIGYDGSGDSRKLVWLDDPRAPAPVLPREMLDEVVSLGTTADGALVAVSTTGGAPVRAAAFAPTWHQGDGATTFTGKKFSHCVHVPAADKTIVLKCGNWGASSTLVRVTSKAFEPVLDEVPPNVTAASVARDGSVFLTIAGKREVRHCPAPKGECRALPFPKDLMPTRAAHYEVYSSDVVDEKGRSWFTLHVDGLAKEYAPSVDAFAMAAKSEEDLWVAVRTGARVVLLHAGAPKEPSGLPSATDARVLVRNVRAPHVWTGHCDQVFVKLGSKDAAAWAKRAPQIQKALGSEANSYENAFQWSLVDGRLADQHVVGVVVARRDVEEKQEKMEAAIDKLIVAMTPDPMNVPPAYCTLPVLEHKLFPSE